MTMRRCSLLSGASAAAWALAAAGQAQAVQAQAPAPAVRAFRIPSGALGDALTAYAAQADRQLLFSSDMVSGLRTRGLSGRHTPDAALTRLLAGSGLAWLLTGGGVEGTPGRPAGSAPAEPTARGDQPVRTPCTDAS